MPVNVRAVRATDYPAWRSLWDGYNAFYGRQGDSALPEDITAATWNRMLDPNGVVRAFVADEGGPGVVALAHYLFHPSTTRLSHVCYLQDLFTAPTHRGKGIARTLIAAVAAAARGQGCSRLYWQTRQNNHAARALYDRVARFDGFVVYTQEL